MKYYKLLYDYEHEDNSIFLEIDEKTLSFDRYEAEKGIESCDWNVDIKVNYDISACEAEPEYLQRLEYEP